MHVFASLIRYDTHEHTSFKTIVLCFDRQVIQCKSFVLLIILDGCDLKDVKCNIYCYFCDFFVDQLASMSYCPPEVFGLEISFTSFKSILFVCYKPIL